MFMRSYASKKHCPDEKERLERQLIRDYVLISANTLLRVGEARQLVWGDIERIEDAYDSYEEKVKLVYINVRAETSKVRASRRVIARGGEYFERLKARQDESNTSDEDYVFSQPNTNKKLTARRWQKHWANLMDGIGVTDWKERNLTWYSLRHFGITARVAAGVSPMNISKLAGTSISHIENTYYKHRDEIAKSAALVSFSTTNEGILVSG